MVKERKKRRRKAQNRMLGTGTECGSCGKVAMRATFFDGRWYGPCCLWRAKLQKQMKVSTFPFTTSHLTGHAVTVNSMRHLRSLERQHGVQFLAYNSDEKNFDKPLQHDPRLQDIRNHYKPKYGDALQFREQMRVLNERRSA